MCSECLACAVSCSALRVLAGRDCIMGLWAGESGPGGHFLQGLRGEHQDSELGLRAVLVPFASLWAGGVLAAPAGLPSRWVFPSHLPLPLPPGEGKEREEEEEKRHRRAERRSCLPSRRRGRGDGGVGDKRQRGGDGRGGRR